MYSFLRRFLEFWLVLAGIVYFSFGHMDLDLLSFEQLCMIYSLVIAFYLTEFFFFVLSGGFWRYLKNFYYAVKKLLRTALALAKH